MASGVRLDAGKVMEAVRSPGDHRRVAGVELLRRRSKVTVGRTTQNETEGEEGSRR
jgi:hypothetical protein